VRAEVKHLAPPHGGRCADHEPATASPV
jgi:hypothetical protein